MHLAQDQRERYRWGMALAWVPLIILYVFGLRNTFRGMSANKATGLGAVAGGFAEGMAILGVVSLIATQVVSIVLLFRAVSKGNASRIAVAIVTIGFSLITLVLAGAVVSFWFHLGVF